MLQNGVNKNLNWASPFEEILSRLHGTKWKKKAED